MAIPAHPVHRGGSIVVIGDTLVDEEVTGAVHRLSAEAPVPIISDAVRAWRPGGAGLAAILAAMEVGSVTFITALADDHYGQRVPAALRTYGVEAINMGSGGQTPMKTRLRGDGRLLAVLDNAPVSLPAVSPSSVALERLLAADAVLVSDYGRGVADSPAVRSALSSLAGSVPLVWDPHPGGRAPVAGVTLATPNRMEAAHFAAGHGVGTLQDDLERAAVLRDVWSAAGVAVTRGADGAVLSRAGRRASLVVPAPSVRALDTCGAGDRFAVTAVTALASDRDDVVGAVIDGVRAATSYVAGSGTVPFLDTHRSPALTCGAPERSFPDPATVVATSGCFDLLHRGHVSLLRRARALGDRLVVCLNSDASIRRMKGHARPIIRQAERVEMLQALDSVDEVRIFDDLTPTHLLAMVRPAIYVKGSDYLEQEVPEAGVVEAHGGRVVILPNVPNTSTTFLIERIVRRAGLGGVRC